MIFFGEQCPDDETILAEYLTENVISGNIYSIRSLNTPTGIALIGFAGWNGTVIPSTFYNKFDANDIRRKQFLVGLQPDGTTYTTDVSSLIDPGAGPNEGIRDVKFYVLDPTARINSAVFMMQAVHQMISPYTGMLMFY